MSIIAYDAGKTDGRSEALDDVLDLIDDMASKSLTEELKVLREAVEGLK